MKTMTRVWLACLLATNMSFAIAQEADEDGLKMTALNALMSAPPERALPIVTNVLDGDGSVALKQRALFVLSQINGDAAQELLLHYARSDEPALQHEAVRAIGIGGDREAIESLSTLYADADHALRDAIHSAYVIAGYAEGFYRIALNTDDPEEFEQAVNLLGAIGALDELRALRERGDMADKLIHAFAMAGDVETLSAMAQDSSNPEQQARAIRGLGIAGRGETAELLLQIYRSTEQPEIRESVRQALLMGGMDETALTLYRESSDPEDKRNLLQLLVMMDSEAAWDVIGQTLEEDE